MSSAALAWQPALDRPDLLAPVVVAALQHWPHSDAVEVAEIDPSLADTAALTTAYGLDLSSSANCVVVAGRRGGDERVAACVVLATTRADVNNLVKRRLDVRKASFLGQDEAVRATRMEYGGITPVGLPPHWRLFVDAAVAQTPSVIVGSGVRRSKLQLPGSLVAALPAAEVMENLGLPLTSGHNRVMGDVVAVGVRVFGNVQGVFFRDNCRKEADRLGVAGWVRNEPDGRVGGHFEGSKDAVDALVEWCRQGSPQSDVAGVDVHDAQPQGLSSFEVRGG